MQHRQQRRGREHRHGDDEDRAERHRAQRGGVDEPQAGERDDHGQAGEDDRDAGRRHRAAARALGRDAGLDLLAVAREHEERVVDRDADADHRGHVGHEDRHLHLAREHVDQRAGDRAPRRRRARAAAPRPRASRRPRAGSAARSGSPAPRPSRGPPCETSCSPAHSAPWPTRCVATGPPAGVPTPSRRAGPSRRRCCVVVDRRSRSGTIIGRAAPRSAWASAARRAAGASATWSVAAAAARRARAPRAASAADAPGRGTRTAPSVRARARVEVALSASATRRRLRARHAEAAAGQVLGLARGERERGDQHDDPRGEHPPRGDEHERVEPEHEVLHGGPPWRRRWLASQPGSWLAGQRLHGVVCVGHTAVDGRSGRRRVGARARSR